jgi:hypothetical protein
VTIVLALLTGIALAACAGLRVFLPLLAAGLAARFGDWPLAESMGWLASDAALVAFGAATLLEIAADKVPAVDHALDAAQTLLAPVAGAAVAVSALGDVPPLYALGIGVAAGAPIAGGVHFLAATSRLHSTALTAGTANPLLSLAEDVMAVLGVIAAIVVPFLSALALAALVIFLWRRRARRRAT